MMGREAPFTETEVIGVVKNVTGNLSLRETDRRMIYFPYRQDLALNTHPRLVRMCLAVRTLGDPARLKASIREELRHMDPNLPVVSMESVDEQLDEAVAQERLIATLSSCFGSLAMLLACLGLYGVISCMVARRTNEIGIRLALGATPAGLLRMVLKESLWLVLAGIAIGVPPTLALTRLISTMLYGVKASDPLTMVGATLLMVAVAAMAALIPARKASRVDPLVALRYE